MDALHFSLDSVFIVESLCFTAYRDRSTKIALLMGFRPEHWIRGNKARLVGDKSSLLMIIIFTLKSWKAGPTDISYPRRGCPQFVFIQLIPLLAK